MLAPLFERDGELHVIFTSRATTCACTPGRSPSPAVGARRGDTDLLATALREARRGDRPRPAAVDLLGALQPTPTSSTGYAVYPFVGLIDAPPGWELAVAEVDAIIELPLRALAASHQRRTIQRDGRTFETDVYALQGHEIWGATGRILTDLFARLGQERLDPA